MSDALTVDEVERFARIAEGALYGLPWPVDAPWTLRQRVDQALTALHELRWLCELVRNADAGLVVVVEHEDAAPA